MSGLKKQIGLMCSSFCDDHQSHLGLMPLLFDCAQQAINQKQPPRKNKKNKRISQTQPWWLGGRALAS